jgi:NitT/TauT family transport system substrate-binding protein
MPVPKGKLTPFTKILIVAVLIVGAYFGIKSLQNNGALNFIAPSKKGSETSRPAFKGAKGDVVKVGVVTWGGYAGGQYFNGGFKPSKDSRFFTEYGILVEFKVIDDFAASRAAWKSGEVDLLWQTADAFPTEAEALKEYDPQLVFQADWSRGGDAIVVRRGINSVNDLKGKKIAVAYGTPSNTFILWLLEANNMSWKDVQLVQVNSAIDAAAMFKSGNVDGAVVWSPDDQDCVVKVAGSKVLKSTKEATNIIADVFMAKKAYIESHEKELHGLVEGWLRGAAEINTSAEAKQKASQILSVGMGQDGGFCLNAINNTRLCTFGDNKGFFQIDGCNTCVSGEQLYTKMGGVYQQFGIINTPPPAWRLVSNTSILRGINLAGVEHEAESMQQFSKPTQKDVSAPAFASKAVSIVFASGSAVLSDDAKYTLDKEVVPTLKAFGSVRVRVEGNTDNVGGRESNVVLSDKRARSSVNYLVESFGFDRNRFIETGNGPDKPTADNATAEGRAKNRRTEFQLLN